MSYLRIAFSLTLLLLIFSLAVVACSDDDDDDDDNNDTNDDDDDDDVWTDPVTGLMWQNPGSAEGMIQSEAETYCDDLVYAGFDDWRLPTISELRSLITDCEVTATDGECEVIDDCLWDCFDLICNGCDYEQGPADGCYWNAELTGTCEWYWSSSLDENDSLWGVHFRNAAVGVDDSDDGVPPFVRCVR